MFLTFLRLRKRFFNLLFDAFFARRKRQAWLLRRAKLKRQDLVFYLRGSKTQKESETPFGSKNLNAVFELKYKPDLFLLRLSWFVVCFLCTMKQTSGSKKTVPTQRRSFRPGVYENGAKRNIMQVCQVKKSPWFGFKETLRFKVSIFKLDSTKIETRVKTLFWVTTTFRTFTTKRFFLFKFVSNKKKSHS